MRFIYTVVFIIAFTFPIFSQNNPTIDRILSKANLKSSDKDMITSLITEKKYEHYDKNLNLPNKNENKIKVIPLPPATFQNSQAELLPLHRPGDLIMKFVNKKNKK